MVLIIFKLRQMASLLNLTPCIPPFGDVSVVLPVGLRQLLLAVLQLEDIRARDEVREGQQDARGDEHVARHSASELLYYVGDVLGPPT